MRAVLKVGRLAAVRRYYVVMPPSA